MIRTKPLCSPDGGEGNGPSPSDKPQELVQEDKPAPPPAAKIVVEATRTEREVNLEADLKAERDSHARTAAEKKDRELRICELQDQLQTFRAGNRPAAKKKSSWLFDPFDEN